MKISCVSPVIYLYIYLLISQEQNLSAAMERRCIALLSAFSTAVVILSNLVFLGGIHVGKIFWKRVFIQGKLPPTALMCLQCHVIFNSGSLVLLWDNYILPQRWQNLKRGRQVTDRWKI